MLTFPKERLKVLQIWKCRHTSCAVQIDPDDKSRNCNSAVFLITLQGTNKTHLGKGNHLQKCLGMGEGGSQEGKARPQELLNLQNTNGGFSTWGPPFQAKKGEKALDSSVMKAGFLSSGMGCFGEASFFMFCSMVK